MKKIYFIFFLFSLGFFGGAVQAEDGSNSTPSGYSLKNAVYNLSGLSDEEIKTLETLTVDIQKENGAIENLEKSIKKSEDRKNELNKYIQENQGKPGMEQWVSDAKVELDKTETALTENQTELTAAKSRLDTLMQKKSAAEALPKHLAGVDWGLSGDASDITLFLQRLTNGIAGVAAAVAILFLVNDAFNLVIATGNTEDIAKAKKGMIWALVGLIVIIGAFIVVKTVISLTYSAEVPLP